MFDLLRIVDFQLRKNLKSVNENVNALEPYLFHDSSKWASNARITATKKIYLVWFIKNYCPSHFKKLT